MRRHLMAAALLALAAVFLAACTAGNEDDRRQAGVFPKEEEGTAGIDDNSGGRDVPFELVDTAGLAEELADKVEEYQRERGAHVFHDGPYTYILISMGEMPGEGHYITLSSVAGFEEHIVIYAFTHSPGERGPGGSGPAYPVLLLRMPRDEREPVLFMSDICHVFYG